MRILLINPSLLQATTGQYEKNLEKQRGIYPPLGLAYIAAALEQRGDEVKIIDCDAEPDYTEKIPALCQKFKPEIVGFYTMTWNYRLAKEWAEKIKKINPKIITILGGPNLTCLPEASMKSGAFDFGVVGEGEITTKELLDKLEGKGQVAFEQIPGLIFRQAGELIINQPRSFIKNLDEIPFPARHLLPMQQYFDVFSKHQHFTTIIATRGCPFNCTFCDRKNRMGRNWRKRSPQNIAREIKEVKEKFGITEFMFFDDNIIIDREWAFQLCTELKKLNIIWECRERVDMIDEEILVAMKEAGCYRIRFGFESGDNEILKILKKDITVEQSLNCARLCKKVGIEIFGYFIIGAPQETEATIKRTIDLALKINSSFSLFSKMILIPGSEIFEYAVGTGQIKPNYWEEFLTGQETNGAPSLIKERLTGETIDSYVKLADRKFYFRPIFILKKILAIKSFSHFVRQAKLGLALFFKTKQ